jgi:hypothetical protein
MERSTRGTGLLRLSRDTGSNLADLSRKRCVCRSSVRVICQRLARSIEAGREATRKACGVLVAMPQGHSRAPLHRANHSEHGNRPKPRPVVRGRQAAGAERIDRLAVMAADAAAKGAAETVPASRPSPWQKFGGSWQLATHPSPLTSPSSAHAHCDGHTGADDAKPSPAAAPKSGGCTRSRGGPGKRTRAGNQPTTLTQTSPEQGKRQSAAGVPGPARRPTGAAGRCDGRGEGNDCVVGKPRVAECREEPGWADAYRNESRRRSGNRRRQPGRDGLGAC